jgi:hypothetical protein
LFRFSAAATLTGLTTPPESRLLELKPYGITSLKTDLEADEPFSNRASAARVRWEYRPGSDLFVVYTDGRSTIEQGLPRLQNRALTIKLTRFFRR